LAAETTSGPAVAPGSVRVAAATSFTVPALLDGQ
jgi:hypothetical protein